MLDLKIVKDDEYEQFSHPNTEKLFGASRNHLFTVC